MVEEDRLAQYVNDNMRHAQGNGFWLARHYDAAEIETICADMLDLDADLAGNELEQLRPHVTAFLKRQGKAQ